MAGYYSRYRVLRLDTACCEHRYQCYQYCHYCHYYDDCDGYCHDHFDFYFCCFFYHLSMQPPRLANLVWGRATLVHYEAIGFMPWLARLRFRVSMG